MRLLIAVPLLIILVLFALSNRDPVTLGFWPTDLALVVPVSAAILACAAVAFLAGALAVWPAEIRARRRARRAESRIEALEDEIRTLQARAERPAVPPLPPPG